MSDISEITHALTTFRDKRGWQQFHDTKNLAAALMIEAAELNELFLWMTTDESETVEITKLSDELADVLSYAFLIAEKHNIDIKEIVFNKIAQNDDRYPVEKSKNNSKKYTQL